jgi:hypothetical protein
MKACSYLFKKGSKKGSNVLTKLPQRSFAGGAKIIKMGKDTTHFDVCVVGGLNATSLTKFLQNEGAGLQMAIVTDQSKFIVPELYFLCNFEAVKPLKLETGSVGSQIDASSRVNSNVRAVGIHPDENKITLSNGKEYTYKSLVIAPGFDHTVDNIKGLREFEDAGEQTRVFNHIIDKKDRLDRNYFDGYLHDGGDYIVYDPARPHKDEGSSFLPFYYESILRYDNLLGRAADDARIQYWTPNKTIFDFAYANEVTLEECEKRRIDVHLGWELVEAKWNEIGEKIAVFKNVDSDETIERPFAGMS